MHNDRVIDVPGNQTDRRSVYINDHFCDRAVGFIEQHAGHRPFFCYVPTTLPHAPNHCPELGRYAHEPWPEAPKHRAAMITRIDGYVGRIRAAIESAGAADDTLLVFSSDHGPDPRDQATLDSHGPLRGGKRDMHEAGHRVPTIAWGPALVPPGETDALTAFYDWLPTFADLADTPCPETDGLSLTPLLRREREVGHDFYYAEGFGFQVVRRGRMKAMRPTIHGEPEPHVELYDLDADLGETRNLVSEQPGLVHELGELMDREHHEDPAYPLDFL